MSQFSLKTVLTLKGHILTIPILEVLFVHQIKELAQYPGFILPKFLRLSTESEVLEW